MQRTSRPTGYARFSARQARSVLAAVVLGTGLLVGVTLSPLARGNVGKTRPGESDVALYRAEIERIHAGEGYYRAAAAELSERGYPTRNVFNWRTPLPMWLIGRLPAVALGKVLLGGLAAGLILLGFEALAREEDNVLRRPLAATVLLSGPLMPCVLDGLYVMPVLWAGVLIGLSLCAYGVGRPRLGLAFGLAALLMRELALPYCLLAAGIAWWNRRRGELAGWLLGLAAWAVFFAVHCHQVGQLIGPHARAHSEGWVQFGGVGFVIALAQMNAYLLLLPQWVTALYLAAALVGFAGWDTPLGQRVGLTACLFLAAFAAVGQEFNQYWGSLIAPLLCFGVARAPGSLRDLWKASVATAIGDGQGAATTA
jgi:hypothetical protein